MGCNTEIIVLKWERNLIVSKSIPYETEINAEFVIRNAELLIIKPVVIGFPDSNRLILYKIIMLYIFADLYLISNFRYKKLSCSRRCPV